jgi:hypothetical protein
LPHGNNQFFFEFFRLVGSPHNVVWRLGQHHLLFALRALLSSVGILNAIIFILHCKRYHYALSCWLHSCASPGSSIFCFASPHALLDNVIFYLALLAILSSILPHGCAPPAILFSTQPNGHAILAKYFSIWPHGCAYSGKILLLITHQGFFL